MMIAPLCIRYLAVILHFKSSILRINDYMNIAFQLDKYKF
jgi:hypothetical protein